MLTADPLERHSCSIVCVAFSVAQFTNAPVTDFIKQFGAVNIKASHRIFLRIVAYGFCLSSRFLTRRCEA